MQKLVLDEHKNLFRDEESYDQFVKVLSNLLSQDFSPVIAEDTVLGATLSPEATKEFLYERMIRKISTSPKVLDG